MKNYTCNSISLNMVNQQLMLIMYVNINNVSPQAVVVCKYMFQFGFFPWNDGNYNDNPFFPPRIIGIEKNPSYANVDIALLLALFLHRSILRVSLLPHTIQFVRSFGFWFLDLYVEYTDLDFKEFFQIYFYYRLVFFLICFSLLPFYSAVQIFYKCWALKCF